MVLILLRQDQIPGRNLPVNAQGWIIPGNGALALGGVQVVAFVLEQCLVAQNNESVGKAAGDKELTVVISREFYSNVLAECG